MSNWINANNEMPVHGRKVLATYKNGLANRRIIVGQYFEKYKEVFSINDNESECYEYSEEADEYYYLEGWYEQQNNWDEYSSIYVNEGEVDFWMPLPLTPEKATNEA